MTTIFKILIFALAAIHLLSGYLGLLSHHPKSERIAGAIFFVTTATALIYLGMTI